MRLPLSERRFRCKCSVAHPAIIPSRLAGIPTGRGSHPAGIQRRATSLGVGGIRTGESGDTTLQISGIPKVIGTTTPGALSIAAGKTFIDCTTMTPECTGKLICVICNNGAIALRVFGDSQGLKYLHSLCCELSNAPTTLSIATGRSLIITGANAIQLQSHPDEPIGQSWFRKVFSPTQPRGLAFGCTAHDTLFWSAPLTDWHRYCDMISPLFDEPIEEGHCYLDFGPAEESEVIVEFRAKPDRVLDGGIESG